MVSDLSKILLLARLVSFMLLFYLVFGLVVEKKSVREGSKLKAFARLLCRPLVAPVAKLSEPGMPYPKLLLRTTFVFAALWIVLIVASELAAPHG